MHAKKIGEQMLKLINIIENVPVRLSDSGNCRKAIKTSQLLCIGGGVEKNSTKATQFDSTQGDRFWGKSDILNCIAEIEDAHKKQNDFLSRTDDLPKFSLA